MRDILIDFTYYQGGATFHGGGEYGNVVLRELLKQPVQNNCGIFFIKGKRIDKEILKRCVENGWNIHACCDVRNIPSIIEHYNYTTIYSALPYANKWSEVKLPKELRFIGTFHGLRSLELANCENSEVKFFENKDKEICTGYIFEEADESKKFMRKESYRNALPNLDNCKIIAVSEHTKYSIYYHYPEFCNKDIEVLYSPSKLFTMVNGNDKKILQSFGLIKNNYGLIVSAGIWYKNGLRAVLAYDKVFSKQYIFIPDNFKVLVVGVQNRENFEARIINKERFIFVDYVLAEELEVFYQNAQLLVYPSLNEGFGYPPLEAMKYGTLCACSVNTSIVEVCKDMVLYFNPLLIDEIAIRILESFSDKIRMEKVKVMKQQLPVIFERQAKDLKRIIEIIIGEK